MFHHTISYNILAGMRIFPYNRVLEINGILFSSFYQLAVSIIYLYANRKLIPPFGDVRKSMGLILWGRE